MSDIQALTEVQKATGATMPDVTNDLDRVITIALMVPMGTPGTAKCPMGLPIMLWGKSGIGKTARVRQGAKRLDLQIKSILPGTKQPEDFTDLPVVIDNELRTACMLTQINYLNMLGKGVAFVDEASCAVPATQGAMLGFVLDRAVGSTELADQVRIVAAANPPKFAAGGWGLEAPFANRMAHFYVRATSKKKFAQWLATESSETGENLESAYVTLTKNWSLAWSTVKGLLAGFIDSCSDTTYFNQPDPDNDQAGYCWPSPRTWEMAARSVATIRALGLGNDLEQTFAEACVGAGPAGEWFSWIAHSDLPSPEEVLMNGWKVDTSRLDRTLAVYSSTTAYIIGERDLKKKADLAGRGWRRLCALIDAGIADIALFHAQALVQEGYGATSQKIPPEYQADAERAVEFMGTTNLVHYSPGR